MIHELELLPIVLTQVPIYILKIFLLIFLFFGDSQLLVVCFLNILLLNLVSTFSVVLASSIYLIFIVVVTLCQVSRQLANSALDGMESFCIALPLLLMPQKGEEKGSGQIAISLQSLSFSLLLCPVQNTIHFFVRGQYSELGCTQQ